MRQQSLPWVYEETDVGWRTCCVLAYMWTGLGVLLVKQIHWYFLQNEKNPITSPTINTEWCWPCDMLNTFGTMKGLCSDLMPDWNRVGGIQDAMEEGGGRWEAQCMWHGPHGHNTIQSFTGPLDAKTLFCLLMYPTFCPQSWGSLNF